jgi:nuclear pore complex protein Nup160
MDTTVTPSASLFLSKETRVGNEAVPGLSTIQIEVPQTVTGPSTFTSLGRNSRSRRRVLTNLPTAFKDEEDYSQNTLASSSSIYFGAGKKYPRSIQWRILRDSKVLELRSADLSKRDGETREATVVLQLIFPSPIKKGCVALTDAEHSDFLNVFVLTKELDLLTLTLARDFFCYAAASEGDIANWCNVFRPVSFLVSPPHRLLAEKPLQVVVSLCDGRLLNLTREPGTDGSVWRESAHGQGKWAAMLGGLVRWQGNSIVKFEGSSLDVETATGLALSPDARYVYSVCLNHTFKIWSFDKEKSVFATDLAGHERDIHEIPKLLLDPSAQNRIQIFKAKDDSDGDQYYVTTYSPQDLGQFKFWAVRDPDEGACGVRDLFPEHTLRAPDPDPSPESKAIWTVVDFRVTSGGEGDEMDIWVLIRSNWQYRLYNLRCRLGSLTAMWRDNWSMTASETLNQSYVPVFSEDQPKDVTELWLDYMFYPGRYPVTVLETALSMYSLARRINIKTDPKVSFRERLSKIVTSQIQLHKTDDGDKDFKRYREDINQEWTAYWQDVRDLTTSRWNIRSLAFDEVGDIPWITFADGCSAIRDCSRLEVIAHNDAATLAKSTQLVESSSMEVDGGDPEPRRLEELAAVVEAAAAFRRAFGSPLRHAYDVILNAELWEDSLYSVPARMVSFYDRFNFEQEIGDVEISNLEAGLELIGGYSGLETDLFLAIINELPQFMIADVSGLLSTKFGLKALVGGALEMISLHERLLVDLLILVVFVHAEADREEDLFTNLDAAKIYSVLLEELRKYQLMQWLGRNVRAQKNTLPPVDLSVRILTAREKGREKGSILLQTLSNTVLEDLFVVDVKPQSYIHQSQQAALTQSIQDILKWVTGGNESAITLDIVLVHIQCNLLANNNLELANDFLLYQPCTAWATYIKGRLCLIKGEYDEAALYFKKAAFKLCNASLLPSLESRYLTSSTARPGSRLDYQNASHNLLSSLEAAYLGQDLPTYYSHILTLFDISKCPSWVSSFAHLALQFTPKTDTEQSASLLSALVHSSLSTCDHDSAYAALIQHPDPPSLIPTLITAMLTDNKAAKLIGFPFPPDLHPAIDSFLLQKARSSPIDPRHDSLPLSAYHILSSWRLRHHNAQGAAAALLERLQRLPESYALATATATATATAGATTTNGERDAVLEDYLAVINLLSCAGEGWVLSGGKESRGSGAGIGAAAGVGGVVTKRKVVTLEDVRKTYQDELDRRSVMENGRFGFGLGFDAMDVL